MGDNSGDKETWRQKKVNILPSNILSHNEDLAVSLVDNPEMQNLCISKTKRGRMGRPGRGHEGGNGRGGKGHERRE